MKTKAVKLVATVLAICMLAACGQNTTAESYSEESSIQSSASVSSVSSSASSESSEFSSSAISSLQESVSSAPVHSEASSALPSSTEPTSSEISQQISSTAPANPFSININGDYSIYSFNADLFAYSCVGITSFGFSDAVSAICDAINELPLLTEAQTAPQDNPLYGLLFISTTDYSKTRFFLYDGILGVDDKYYSITTQQYEVLKQAMNPNTSEIDPPAPYWLVYMNPMRVTDIWCTNREGTEQNILKENLIFAAVEAQYIYVTAANPYEPATKDLSAMPFKAEYLFDNGVLYTVYVSDISENAENIKMYVQISNSTYGYEYTATRSAASYARYTQEMLYEPANPRSGKPIIYLYPKQKQDIDVKLNFAGKLAYTYPAYNNGWSVTASSDGELINKSDKSVHYYLFWEGTANKRDWDFSQGFVVSGEQTEAFLCEKLPLLGLTPREYNDFITYWVPELMQNPYNLITFATDEYDKIAELDISPKPDTVLRVHMVWKPLDAPINIEEQTLPTPPDRNGFTVVEWGGTRA